MVEDCLLSAWDAGGQEAFCFRCADAGKSASAESIHRVDPESFAGIAMDKMIYYNHYLLLHDDDFVKVLQYKKSRKPKIRPPKKDTEPTNRDNRNQAAERNMSPQVALDRRNNCLLLPVRIILALGRTSFVGLTRFCKIKFYHDILLIDIRSKYFFHMSLLYISDETEGISKRLIFLSESFLFCCQYFSYS